MKLKPVRMNGVKKENTNGVSNGFGPKTPFLIGVAGGTASGKSTVCKRIMEKLGQDDIDHSQRRVVCISQDAFYRPLNVDESAKALKGAFNFDHPEAFDTDLILKTLKKIQAGEICNIPDYDYVTNSRLETQTTIYPADVILFEGILMFYQKEIRDLFHMKLFVDSDADTRLARRVMRDTRERGRNLENVLHQYTKLVKPAFEEFCLPTKKFADVIIPRGAENTVAINLIVLHITEILHIDLSTNKTTSSNATGRQENSTSAASSKLFISGDESSCSATATLNEIILASSCAGPPVLSPSSARNQPLLCGQQTLDSPPSVGAGGIDDHLSIDE